MKTRTLQDVFSRKIDPFHFFYTIGWVLLLVESSIAAVQTDGPLVGGVTDRSAKVFARTHGQAFVAIEFSNDALLASPAQIPPVLTTADSDFTAILTLDGLQPETTYYYRVLVNGVPQQIALFPSFSTFPPPDTIREFRFVVLSDLVDVQRFPTIPTLSYARIMEDNPAFVLQIGDFDHRSPRSLPEMRQMHREVRGPYNASGLDFSLYIAPRFPLFHVWDDYDYGLNNGDKTFPGRGIALQAFKEYYPTPDLANPTAGIWHKFTYGQAEFFMLDLRSQRDAASDPDDFRKSMLDGNNIVNGQKEWLKANLLASTARWKFVISSVPFNSTLKLRDSWASFTTERAELLNFIRQNGVQGVIVLSGDLHSGGGIDNGIYTGLPEMSIPQHEPYPMERFKRILERRSDIKQRPRGICPGYRINQPGPGRSGSERC
jgi:alkaline phosphatase D